MKIKVGDENSVYICTNCGCKLDSKSEFCHKCGRKIEKMKKCRNCGEISPFDSEFCQYCGEIYESKSKKLSKNKLIVIVITALIFAITICFLSIYVIAPNVKYYSAISDCKNGKYENAIKKFKDLNDFKDSKKQINETNYQKGMSLKESKKYRKAAQCFLDLDGYSDSIKQLDICLYMCSMEYIKLRDIEDFITLCDNFKYNDFTVPYAYSDEYFDDVIDYFEDNDNFLSDDVFMSSEEYRYLSYLPDNFKYKKQIEGIYEITGGQYEYGKSYVQKLKKYWSYEPLQKWLTTNKNINEFMLGKWRSGDYYMNFTKNKNSFHCSWLLPSIINDNGYDYYNLENKKFVFTKKNSDAVYKVFKFEFKDENTISAYCYRNKQYYSFKR